MTYELVNLIIEITPTLGIKYIGMLGSVSSDQMRISLVIKIYAIITTMRLIITIMFLILKYRLIVASY